MPERKVCVLCIACKRGLGGSFTSTTDHNLLRSRFMIGGQLTKLSRTMHGYM